MGEWGGRRRIGGRFCEILLGVLVARTGGVLQRALKLGPWGLRQTEPAAGPSIYRTNLKTLVLTMGDRS